MPPSVCLHRLCDLMSLLRFDLDTEHRLLSCPSSEPRDSRVLAFSSNLLLLSFFPAFFSSFLFSIVQIFHIWTFRFLFTSFVRTVLDGKSIAIRGYLVFFDGAYYRATTGTFTRSLNSLNNKRLFRLSLVNRTPKWNNRTIIWLACSMYNMYDHGQQRTTRRAAACAVIEFSTTQNNNEFNKERVTIRFDNRLHVYYHRRYYYGRTRAKNPCLHGSIQVSKQ